jgi:hypothetical protein
LCFAQVRCKRIQGRRLDRYLLTTSLLYTVPWHRREMLAGQDWLDWLKAGSKRNAGAACPCPIACRDRFTAIPLAGSPGGSSEFREFRVYTTWISKLFHLPFSLRIPVELSMKRTGQLSVGNTDEKTATTETLVDATQPGHNVFGSLHIGLYNATPSTPNRLSIRYEGS